MISLLKIKNLKCFEEVSLDINNFTLLVGMNSAGKSTVIQSLLLAIQNITDDGMSPLNGRLISLGHFADARNFIKNAKSINVSLYSNEENMLSLTFFEENDSVKCEIRKKGNNLYEYLDQKNKRITYISSKRIGSQDTYMKNYDKYNDIGVYGEYAIDFFDKNKSNPINDTLIRDRTISSTLEGQVNYWLKYIINSELTTEDITGTDQVRAQYAYVNNRSVRPKNIGSGISYIVSILVSALSARDGDLLIIENPEIHLHPRAQSKLTEFISYVADKGIKFIIETHSDHIFNGVRKSIKSNIIDKEDVAVHFFSMDEEKLVSNITKIELISNGNVLNHQPGLFDQFDDDLDELLGLR